MCCVWAARYIEEHTIGKCWVHSIMVSMANAMPQAIGAALACPGKQVIGSAVMEACQ